MDLTKPGTRIGSLRLWVLVILLMFLVLFGVHLFALHHDGDSHAFELALTIQVALALLVSTPSGKHLAIAPAGRPGPLRARPRLKVPLALSPGFVAPIRT